MLLLLGLASPGHAEVAHLPVLIVPGIVYKEREFRPMLKALRESGRKQVEVVTFDEHFGEGGIASISKQVAEAAKRLKADTNSTQIDVIGFSMGALAARYMIQRLGGKDDVRRFISISGPHHGTVMAYFGPFFTGVREMQPNSTFLQDLLKDQNPFGKVRVYAFYTPYDAMVSPSQSAILEHAQVVKSFQVTFHHQMLKDDEVLSEVVGALSSRSE